MKGFVLVTLLALSAFGYRISNPNSFDLVWDEWGYDGFYTVYNATGEVVYDVPTANAFCVNVADFNGNNYPTNCSIFQDWRCRGWLAQAIPSDFQYVHRDGRVFRTADPVQGSFYFQQQLHWFHIMQSGGNTGFNGQGKICVETLGTAPYRRVLFSWHEMPFTTQIKFFETTNVLEFVIKTWTDSYKPYRLGFEGNYAIAGGGYNQNSNVSNFNGLVARYAPAACPTGTQFPSMRCVSEKRFQMCSNGRWSMPLSCQTGTFCNPDGNSIFCGFSNPLAATTTTGSATATTTTTTTTTTSTTSTTAAVTSGRVTSGPVTSGRVTSGAQPVTSGRLTTNNVPGAALVIESPKQYLISLSTEGANDYWIDTHSYIFGQVNQKAISWGPEYNKPVTKTDGQFDDLVDPTITHVWTELTSSNPTTNFFPSIAHVNGTFYDWQGGSGRARWRSEAIYFGSDFTLLGTELWVYDSQGNLRGHGKGENINYVFDWPQVPYPQIDTYADMDYTGNPINNRVRFEFTARRANNQPITSGTPPVTTAAAATTGSASCNVGATRCVGAQYQTCVYTWGGSSWVGGWGVNQNCAAGTSCVQYGTSPNTYIGCS